MSAPNVLILDEPTNDLDIQTMVTLENYLDSFGGCLIVVSHERYFLDRTIDHIFRFEAGGAVREYPGNYAAFLEAWQRDERAATTSAATVAGETEAGARFLKKEREATAESPASAKRKLSFKEQRELGELEARIEEAERRQTEIETELAANASDAHLVHQLFKERETLAVELARALDRWAELAERA
jgi:ATP-binding cassette subfamily F protein uup